MNENEIEKTMDRNSIDKPKDKEAIECLRKRKISYCDECYRFEHGMCCPEINEELFNKYDKAILELIHRGNFDNIAHERISTSLRILKLAGKDSLAYKSLKKVVAKRNNPLMVIQEKEKSTYIWKCPLCNEEVLRFTKEYKTYPIKLYYCFHCGQRIIKYEDPKKEEEKAKKKKEKETTCEKN